MATDATTRRQVEFPTHERPHTEISVSKMFGIATAFTVVFFFILYLTPPTAHNFPRDLFIGAEVTHEGDQLKVVKGFMTERVIFQGMITLVWACSMATVVLKLQRLKAEKASLEEDLIPEGIDMGDTDKLIEIYNRLKGMPEITESLGVSRVARVLAMWINTGDFERTAEFAHLQSDVDAAVSDSSYRTNRLYIWAMPLLGFVGTVFGVAAGISGFAAFLSSGNVSAQQITVQVGEITTGLAVAFFCTLLGLLTAGLAAFPSLMAERKEEGVLSEIDEYVEDRLLSHMPSGGAAALEQQKFPIDELVGAIRDGMSGLTAQTKFPVEELAQAIDAGFRRLPNPERYEEVFSKAVAKAGDVINQKYEEFQTNYERRIGELGSTLGGKLGEVANNFNSGTTRMMADFTKAQDKTLEQFAKNDAKLTENFEELTEKVTAMGKEIAEQIGESHETYLEAVTDLDKKEIQRWEKMVNDFNQLSVKLADSFKQSVSTLDSASGRYADRIQQSVQQLTDQLEKITQLGNEIDKVLRTTQSMEATLRQVGSSDEFRQTLANIRNHLVTSDELLKQLSKPRKVVFQEARSDDM